MSTRGVIARVGEQEGSFRGVYNHSDSYPTWLGPRLWHILHGRYDGNVSLLVKETIEDHPCGWSVYGECCYCHDRSEDPTPVMIFTHDDFASGDDGDSEWLWVFDPDNKRLFVRDLRYGEDLAPIELSGPEPDWEVLECGEHFERCQHCAGAHLPELKESPLDM